MPLLVVNEKIVNPLGLKRDYHQLSPSNREKLLRHIAMVAKFLDDNKLNVNFYYFKLHRSYSIHLICQMLAKFSGAKAVRTLSKFNKGKRKCLCCVHLLPKAGA